jgi:hypothetical protein
MLCIDCARLPREAMIVTLPHKVDTMLPRFDAGHEHGKQTNEFAAHEQLRAIDTLHKKGCAALFAHL